MDNSKETEYLKLVRIQSDTNAEFTAAQEYEFEQHLKSLSLSEKIEWRGLQPSTIVIALVAYCTVVAAGAFMIVGGVLSLL